MREQLDLFNSHSLEAGAPILVAENMERGGLSELPCSICFELSSYRVPYKPNGARLCRCCLSRFCNKHSSRDSGLCFRCIAKGRW